MKKRIVFEKSMRFLFLFLFVPLWLSAQNITVTGKVTDNEGDGLMGVSITEKGTTNGIASDGEGGYSLTVSRDAILEFSYLGFATQSIPVQGRTLINVILQEDTKALEEVVVIGYGSQRRKDVTGAVAQLTEQSLREVPATNIAQSMQGKLPGVSISQTTNRPGGDSQIRIRGSRSLSATNDPLIIVDGIPFLGSLNDISPNDIKQIDVLKDASATAIYGSRGANGVIIVTTNRGNYNEPVVSYNGYGGIGTIAKKYPVFNVEEYLQMKDQPGNTWALMPQEIAGQQNGTETDWQDLLYKTAKIQSHDLSISAGSQSLSGSAGLSYYDETAVLPGQEFSRISARATLDFTHNWFKFGINSQNAFSTRLGEDSNSPLFGMLASSPLVAPYNSDGTIYKQVYGPAISDYSPLYFKDLDTWNQTRKTISTINSIYAEIQFAPFLKYRANLGLNYRQSNYGDFYASESAQKSGGLSSASTNDTYSYNWAIENLLYFTKDLTPKHHLEATLMQSAEKDYYDYKSVAGEDLTADYMQFYNLGYARNGVAVDGNTQNYWESALSSIMGRLYYSYAGRYMITASFRTDWSSRLSSGHKAHPYPALALAWNIANENFMKNATWMDMLKLRLGYGQTSNQAIPPYSTLGSMSQNKYNFGTQYVYGYYPSKLGNKNVGWEYTIAYNVGLDWSLCKSRLSGSFDAYIQKTNDLLVAQALPPSSGVGGTVMVNVGDTENKGFEAAIHSQNFVAKKESDFYWNTDFNIAINRNKLVSINTGVKQDVGNGWFVGYPIDVIYDYKKLGIWQTNEADEAAKYGFVPGDIKVEDYNGDGKIDGSDRYVTNTFEPDFVFGFNNTFGYKNFDLSVITYGQSGGTLVSTLYQGQSYLNRLDGRRNQIKVDYWRTDNPTNAYPRINSGMVPTYNYTLGYFGASYWKIKTITLGYTIPASVVKSIRLSELRVYATCNNVATLFSPYMKAGGIDPQPTGYYASENGGGNQQARQLIVGQNTPPNRQFLFGLNVKF